MHGVHFPKHLPVGIECDGRHDNDGIQWVGILDHSLAVLHVILGICAEFKCDTCEMGSDGFPPIVGAVRDMPLLGVIVVDRSVGQSGDLVDRVCTTLAEVGVVDPRAIRFGASAVKLRGELLVSAGRRKPGRGQCVIFAIEGFGFLDGVSA